MTVACLSQGKEKMLFKFLLINSISLSADFMYTNEVYLLNNWLISILENIWRSCRGHGMALILLKGIRLGYLKAIRDAENLWM